MARPPALVHLAQQPARAAAAAASAAATAPAQLPLSRRSFSSAAAAPSTTTTRSRSTQSTLNGWTTEQQPLARRRSAPSSSVRLLPLPHSLLLLARPDWQLTLALVCAQRSFHASSTRALNKNPYSVLGVKKESSANEIKKAYYGVRPSLSPSYHPHSGHS